MTEYRLLGPFEVVRGGRAVDLGGPKQRALLAMLLLDSGRVVSTDRLAEHLWNGRPPANMLGSLQVYVSHLRRALRDEERATSPIRRQAPGYLVDVDAAVVDLTLFHRGCDDALTAIDGHAWPAAVDAARNALALVRGRLLAEFGDEEWVRMPADAVDERRRACEQALVTGLLGVGRSADALGVSRRLVVEQPTAERSCWLHMVTLFRAGRVGEALSAYREHVRALDDDLGLDPGPALRDLHAAILRQDRDLEHWPATRGTAAVPGVVQPAPVPPPAPRPPSAREAFVGRAHELAVITDLVAESRGAGTRWLALTGPAGIGKTRLAEQAAAAWATDGGRVVRARCPDDDGVPSLWPVRQVLRELGHDPAVVLSVAEGADADIARYEAYDRVVTLLRAAAGTVPLLLLVDDVQWADSMSLRLLTHLLEVEDVVGLAVVLTVRDVKGAPQLARLLGGVGRHAGARQVALPPLSADDVGQLAATVRGAPVAAVDARRLAVRTGGNPFFVCEYARLTDEQLAAGEIPDAIRAVLRLRLAAVDSDVLAVLETAAVAGSVLDVDLLCAAVDQDREALADRLDDAADGHLLVVDPASGAYMFAHALLRAEVLARLSPARRQRLNLAVAGALGETATGEALGKRAAHLVAALPLGDARVALAACRAAAHDAEQAWQSESAATFWELALQALDRAADATPTERVDLTTALVAALARSGRSQTVLDTVDAALLDAVRAGQTASAGRLAAVLLRTSGNWPWVAYGDDAGPLLAHLAGVVDHVTGDPAARVRLLAALAVGLSYDGPEVRDRLSAEAIAIAERLDDPDVLADALLGRAISISAIAPYAEETIALLDRLATVPHAFAPVDAVIAQGILFNARMALGDPACADHVRAGVTGADLLRLPTSRMQMRWAQAELQHWRGEDLGAVESLYEQAWAAHQRTELYASGGLDIARLTLAWDRGLLAESPELAEVDARVLPWARAMVAVAADAPDADDLVRAAAAGETPLSWMAAAELTMGAHTVADRGLRELATPMRDRLAPFAGYIANVGVVGIMGPVDLALARLCALDGDRDAARRHLAVALHLAERAGGRPSALRARLVTAELDAEAGSVDAGELARLADEAARRGMAGVERDARALLAAPRRRQAASKRAGSP